MPKQTAFHFFNTADLEEILACMEDSDRYIQEGRKDRIINQLKEELVKRGQKQYA